MVPGRSQGWIHYTPEYFSGNLIFFDEFLEGFVEVFAIYTGFSSKMNINSEKGTHYCCILIVMVVRRDYRMKHSTKSRIGFSAALGAAILAVGAAVLFGVYGTSLLLEDPQPQTQDETPQTQEPQTQQTQIQAEEIPVEQTNEPEEEVAVEEPALVYAMPLEGEVVNPYSGGELVKNITLKEWRTHDGADLAAAEGTPVKAIADGTVVELEEDPLWGVCLAVSHSDGTVSYYMGISANVEVSVDDAVTVGQTLGYVGNTAQIEIGQESHLHLGLRSGEEWVDPISYIETHS